MPGSVLINVGFVGVRFDLLPEMRDVDAQILTVFLGLRSPDFAQDVTMRQHAASMAHEQTQKRILRRGQFHFPAGRASRRARVRSTTRSPFVKTETSSSGRVLRCAARRRASNSGVLNGFVT